MTVYISGPITGREGYREAFAAEAHRLREQGFVVLDPSMLPEGLGDHETYMHICLPMVEVADRLVMLPGWENSVGARQERALAQRLGKPVEYRDTAPSGAWKRKAVAREPLWSDDPESPYLTNLNNDLMRLEYSARMRELGRVRYNDIMTEQERRQFDRDMIRRYGKDCPPPGRAEWLLKVWEFT